MKTLVFMILTIFLCTSLNAQSMIHVGAGIGSYGGVTAEPYKSPFTSFFGVNIDCEYQYFFQPIQSFSLRARYAGYDKSPLFSPANSQIYSFGIAYSYSNVIPSEKHYNEVSPIIEYGIEKINWVEGKLSAENEPEGEDEIKVFTVGCRFSRCLKTTRFVYKLSLIVAYDHIISAERSIFLNDQIDTSYLNDPEYKTDVYWKLMFSIGSIL